MKNGVQHSIWPHLFMIHMNEINLCTVSTALRTFVYKQYPYPLHITISFQCIFFCIGIGNSVSKTIRLMFSFFGIKIVWMRCESSRKKTLTKTHAHAPGSVWLNSFSPENLTSCMLLMMLKIKVTFRYLSLEICIFDYIVTEL